MERAAITKEQIRPHDINSVLGSWRVLELPDGYWFLSGDPQKKQTSMVVTPTFFRLSTLGAAQSHPSIQLNNLEDVDIDLEDENRMAVIAQDGVYVIEKLEEQLVAYYFNSKVQQKVGATARTYFDLSLELETSG